MWTEDKLDALPSQPSEALIEDIKALSGDIILLGAGGKVGPNLALMAKRAVQAAGVKKRVIAVSRFSDPIARGLLENNGIETISADLLEEGALEKLPDAESLLRTLTFYYLDADCRIAETAQAMYLHRNTVKYRLNKVHNLLQVRLGNPADLHFMQRLSGYYRLYSVS